MPFIIDASVIAGWALGESDRRVIETRERLQHDGGMAPWLWWFKLRNALVQNERRGRVRETESTEFLDRLSRLAVTLDDNPDGAVTMALARRHRPSVYDASYFELALRKGLALATLDGPLAVAAHAEGVMLVGDH